VGFIRLIHCVRARVQDSLSEGELRGVRKASLAASVAEMAEIFVSYTSKDRDWAFWIGQELEKLGHVARLHDWEVSAGGNIMAWMDERADKAERVLCVVSSRYLEQPYSALERHGAQWAAASKRPNFLLPVFIESCEAPILMAPLKRCDLHGLKEVEARARLDDFLKPAVKPAGPVRFPGTSVGGGVPPTSPVAFPGSSRAISNIPINVPWHFLGREDDLGAIHKVLSSGDGRAAITALHGLRGVGKTVLAAAYAERHSRDYRVTWWIRAETDATIRADLVGLGVQLDWVKEDVAEEMAVKAVLDRLTREGTNILLIYDNARNSRELVRLLPRSAGPRIIITSNAPDWRAVALPVEIEVWPKDIGAEFLMARAGRATERDAALALSDVLGGLPLAHEQAAAYCDRIGIPLAEYLRRFRAAPAVVLDHAKDVAQHYGLTVTKTFGLAIKEAGDLHPAAEQLMIYAALLAPEPIPLFLFAERCEQFSGALESALLGDGLDEAVGVLRAFALIDRELVPDERDPSIVTDCIRLHRLVREVARARCVSKQFVKAELINAVVDAYPEDLRLSSAAWPRARRLDAVAIELVKNEGCIPEGTENVASVLLDALATYRMVVLAAYTEARSLYERALAIDEKVSGPDHPQTAVGLTNLANLLTAQGDLTEALPLYERSLAIGEKAFGPDHPDMVPKLGNLGSLLHDQGDFEGARRYLERALTICEKALSPDDPNAATTLNQLGLLLLDQDNRPRAQQYLERALAIYEKTLGPDHTFTATCLVNVGALLLQQGDLPRAMSHLERGLAIRKNALGPDHPHTRNVLKKLEESGLAAEAAALRQKFGIKEDGK
jgi:tetratricopeptide (TPR) repeat protein